MRRLLVIVTVALCAAVPVRAQRDTVFFNASLCENITMTATSVGLIGAGTLAAFHPDVNSWAVSLRDEVMYHNPPKLTFDNYIQYLPAFATPVMNLCGVEGRHNFNKLVILEGGSYLLGMGWLNAFKYYFAKERPDSSTKNSFPSGHTFTAFVGAEVLRREYGKEYPWIAVAGYAVATLVGVMRVYNNRHWAGDVLAGAGLGILSTTLVYWVLD